MANNNVQNIKFLRNGSVFTPSVDPVKTAREVALATMDDQLNNLADGTAILGRYQEDNGTVKTLVGFAYVSGNTKTLTVFDVEGASADVEGLRQEINAKLGNGIGSGASETVTAQLTALSGNGQSTSAETSVEGAKRYADELKNQMDYTGVTIGDAVVVTNVTEADGVVAATFANVGNLKLTDYTKGSDSGAVVATDTINAAVAKLENQIDAEKDARAAAIEALDYTDTAMTKQFVAAVNETNGVISVTRGTISSSAETIVLTDNADGGVNFEVNIDNDTIVQDETSKKLKVASAALTQYVGDEDTIHISAVDSSTNTKTISSPLTISATTPTEANVKEQYNLVGASGNTIGATIKIYKDSALLSVALLHADTTSTPQVLPTYDKATNSWTDIAESAQTAANQALCYAYEDVSGTTVVAAVPVGSFINEQEFASGVTWDATENKVRGVVDPTSDTFLTVGADGFKLSGVQDAIDAAVDGLDATVSNSGASGHVGVEVVEENGKLTAITVTTNDIASQTKLNELSGKTITEVESSNASISATTAATTTDGTVKVDIVTDASKIKMSGFTSTDALSGITTSSSITESFKEVDRVITHDEEVTAAALNDLNTKVNTISGDVETISSNLTSEIAARKAVDGQNGDTYAANSGKAYISGATSLNDADIKLNDALAALDSDVIKSVKVNDVTLVESSNAVNVQITAATSAATGTTAIVVDTDANGNITIGLADIDAGTY